MLWYTTSESYWAPTPAISEFFSASGMPSLSKVSLMYSGTSDQSASGRSDARA